MGNSKLAFVFTFALVLLAASVMLPPKSVQAAPRTLTVPDDYPTIQAAVGNASDGDTVYVKNGIYVGQDSDVWLSIDKSISLVGEDNQQTIICQPNPKAQRDCIIKVIVDSVTISGIHIQGNGAYGIKIADDASPPRHIKVLNCFIEGCQGAIAAFGGYDITIDGNYLTQNGWGVDNRASNTTISNNLIFKNSDGIYQGSGYVYGNVISQNYEYGLALVGGGPHYIYNNNITNNPGYGILFACGGANVFRNEISSNNIALKQDSVADGGKDNYVYGNNFLINQVDFSSSEASTVNVYGHNVQLQPVDIFLKKDIQGNYWSGNRGNGSYLVGDASHSLYDYYPLSQPVNIEPLSITPLPTPTPTNQTPPVDSGNWMINIAIIAVTLLVLILVAVAWILFSRKNRLHQEKHLKL